MLVRNTIINTYKLKSAKSVCIEMVEEFQEALCSDTSTSRKDNDLDVDVKEDIDIKEQQQEEIQASNHHAKI